jgi:hypothetical protein
VAERIPATLLSALIAALLLSACGESNEEGTSAGPTGSDTASATADTTSSSDGETISKSQFLRKADGICEATTEKITSTSLPIIEEEQKKPGYDRKAVEARLMTNVMGPELRSEVERLKDLGIPPGEERQVGAIIDAIEEEVREISTNAEELAQTRGEVLVKPTKLAERYGFISCPYG